MNLSGHPPTVGSQTEDMNGGEDDSSGVGAVNSRVRGHGRVLGKLRLDRGPLRWWLMVIGLLTVEYTFWRFALGLVLVVAAALLHVVSKGYLRPGRKYLNRTKAITTRGPYRFTRNPFYLANLIAELGLLIIIGRVWIAVVYLPIWAWVYWKKILEEERHLLSMCGGVYEPYCKHVPRFLPIPWKMLRVGELSGPYFSWANPHISEGKEIQRALRLISYPFLLRAIAAAMELESWSQIILNSTVIEFAAAFIALNAIGWITTPVLRRRQSCTSHEPVQKGRAKNRSLHKGLRWAAVIIATILPDVFM